MLNGFARLQQGGHKLTGPRRMIIEALNSQRRALTAVELHHQVADRGVSLATVYRTLELLVELDLAERATGGEDEQHYIACLPEHHHHVICSICGQVADVTECLLGEFQALVQAKTNFTIEGHALEFHGHCPACR